MKFKSDLDFTTMKLSIQLSLDGFSFYILEPESKNLIYFKEIGFYSKKGTPSSLLEAIERRLIQENLHELQFKEIELIHENNLFAIVPDQLFDKEHLELYLENSFKIYESDYITHDPLAKIEAQAIYLPFVNINNFVFSKYGEFQFRHASSILVQRCLEKFHDSSELAITLQVNIRSIEFLAIQEGKLLFFNHFETSSIEDILYYIMFCLEQLNIDPLRAKLHLSGYVKNNEALLDLLSNYIGEIRLINLSKVTEMPENEKHKLHRHLLSI